MLAATEYELLILNHLFETGLLMYFWDVDEKILKGEIYRRLSSHYMTLIRKDIREKTVK